MGGPAPKATSRRGKRTQTLQAPTRSVPDLPASCAWPERIRGWWVRLWGSPIATEWDPVVDYETVYRLGGIYAALEADGSAALHAQAARLEAELGLTPRARKSMYVAVESEDDETPTPARVAAVARKPTTPAEDPRRALLK